MTRFDLYDTKGRLRQIETNLTLDQMRVALGEFRTHCNVEGKEYEFNHFANWMAKYSGISIEYVNNQPPLRVDM